MFAAAAIISGCVAERISYYHSLSSAPFTLVSCIHGLVHEVGRRLVRRYRLPDFLVLLSYTVLVAGVALLLSLSLAHVRANMLMVKFVLSCLATCQWRPLVYSSSGSVGSASTVVAN